jgi:hypothetical protein
LKENDDGIEDGGHTKMGIKVDHTYRAPPVKGGAESRKSGGMIASKSYDSRDGIFSGIRTARSYHLCNKSISVGGAFFEGIFPTTSVGSILYGSHQAV